MFDASVKLSLKRPHLNKLKLGKPIQLSHKMLTDKGEMEVFLSPLQKKKLDASLRLGKGMRLAFDPAQIEHHCGCGLFTAPIKKMKKAMDDAPATTMPLKPIALQLASDAVVPTVDGTGLSLKKLGRRISRGFKKVGRDITNVAKKAGAEIVDVSTDVGENINKVASKKNLRKVGKTAIDLGIRSVGSAVGSSLGTVAGTLVANPALGGIIGAKLGDLATQPLAKMAVKKSGLGRPKKVLLVSDGGALFPAGAGGALAPAGEYKTRGMGASTDAYLHDETKDFYTGRPSFYVPYDPARENAFIRLK